MKVAEGRRLNIGQFPNFHRSGSIRGMKKLYYGEDCLLVRCGNYIYNVTSSPLTGSSFTTMRVSPQMVNISLMQSL